MPPNPDATPRQKEALTLYAAGFSRREIAAQLGLSPETVHDHLDDARLRLGIDSRHAAVVWALATGRLDVYRDGTAALLRPAPPRPAPPILTQRQGEVLSLYAQGLSGAEIARRLVVVPATVNWTLRFLRRRCGFQTPSQAVWWAAEHGLPLDPDAWRAPVRPRCKNGHPMDEANRYHIPNRPGLVKCRACDAASMRRTRARRRAA
jgi:DNA-binding NarL/FixJ family response regulator